jgi:short subunit dehydrogenase-like uncharacterized protein
LLIVDLVCETPEQEEELRKIVRQTKVVLTCSGPFEKYGKTLVKICAEEGVHYADITGETDFVRDMVQQYDEKARESGAVIVSHCGNDCIPQDLTVFEMHQHAKKNNAELIQVMTYPEFSASSSWSGGTIATASYQLGKDRSSKPKIDFDPLLRNAKGEKSESKTKNISPKSTMETEDVGTVEVCHESRVHHCVPVLVVRCTHIIYSSLC